MATDNAALMRRWFEEVWNKGNFAVIDELASPNINAQGQAEHPVRLGREEFRAFAHGVRTAFPDIRVTVHETIAQDNRVAVRWSAIMTHQAPFMEIARTGRKATINGITWVKFENGQIVEGWDNWDQMGLLVQLGAVPSQQFVEVTPKSAKSA